MTKAPALFIGHGSPMNAIENNAFTKGWAEIAASFEKPAAILCVSAHWETQFLAVNNAEEPKQIYDFYGFPNELYRLIYQPAGSPFFASLVKKKLGSEVAFDNSWGIDHGSWSVLTAMYKNCDVPVFQLSIPRGITTKEAFEIGHRIKDLREQNVLILGSGNVVHNLRRVDFSYDGGYPLAKDFDKKVKEAIVKRDFQSIIDYKNLSDGATLSVPTEEHFMPLLYVLGASDNSDSLTVFNEECLAGSLSMTSYLFK